MGFRSFRDEETDKIKTLPNGMMLLRGAGGIAVGACLAIGAISPAEATAAIGVLAATDAEGNLIQAAKRFPRIREKLHIYASSLGRRGDAIMDKIMGVAVLTGGLFGGEVAPMQSIMLAPEAATAIASVLVVKSGGDPQVTKVGKLRMAGLCGTLLLDMGAAAFGGGHTGLTQELLADAGNGLAAITAALGSISCYQIYNQMPQVMPEAIRVNS